MGSKSLLFSLIFLIFVSVVYSACTSTPCKCPIGTNQGQYCGSKIGCNPDSVFECNPSGEACEYGFRTTCHNCGDLTCPPPRPPPNCRRGFTKRDPRVICE
ncbi:hypothetical protein C1645_821864 [Glomus cerebriforme]|uniref:Uncharacterized protein n=1 Tax=Glomus cerebriforme TaxID=658196 RepID=A0A397T919_9GLOM|nr:hypothetical protein C1645_821864 [Glomus cerebriforme]